MPSPAHLLLITAAFSIVMLFVLASLLRSGMSGIREWLSANGVAAVALLFYAGRDVIPDVLSIDIASALFGYAACMLRAGFRHFFGLSSQPRQIGAIWLALMLPSLLFHYGHDSVSLRIATLSTFFALICFDIAKTLFRHTPKTNASYPDRFTATVAALFAVGHALRAILYWTGIDSLTSNIQASSWNLVFLSIGTLALPVFTLGAVMMVHDKMVKHAMDAANHDFLTGAWSRRAFFETAERELTRARRTGRAVSLLMLDIDQFKRINDHDGHATGDRVLKDLVERTRLEIRSMDTIARIGGEEFAVLLPEADAAIATAVAQRIRLRLAQHDTSEPSSVQKSVPYTVSIGVATYNGSENLSDLMQRADAALYVAKKQGRNRVVDA